MTDGDHVPTGVTAVAARHEERIANFEGSYGFSFDPFQYEALEALAKGSSVLVAAPTGAGKTVIGEFACELAATGQGKCFYTTPVKALSNQKYRDLVARHGADDVGLLTGDRSVNGEAPIVVMTTEVLRNMIYEASTTLDGLRYVVLDEVHYLADRARGAVWEEVIVQLRAAVQLVALSATVSNAEEFGEWLAQVRDGGCEVVIEEQRPVPLSHHYYVNDVIHPTFTSPAQDDQPEHDAPDHEASRVRGSVPNPYVLQLERRTGEAHGRHRGRRRRLRWPDRATVVEELAKRGWLPAIDFVFSRRGCDKAVRELLSAGINLTDDGERQQIRDIARRTVADIPREDLLALGYESWLSALGHGVAAHHAGMIPAFKEAVEKAFQAGLLRFVVATETLALGINMPAKSVVIERLEKWNGERHALLTPGDYTQLTGRGGRRGIDPVGHAIVLYQRDIDFRTVAGLVGTRTYPLESSFTPSYNMAVNLLRRHDLHHAERLLTDSFAQFQADRSVAGLNRRLDELVDGMEGYRAHLDCERGDWRAYQRLRERYPSLTEADAADEVRSHPCHQCPQRDEHEVWQRRVDELADEAERLRGQVARRTGSLVRDFHRVLDVLADLGYVDDTPAPTDDGLRLAGIYADADLVIAECLGRGVFDGLSAEELAGVCALFVYESRSDETTPVETAATGAPSGPLDGAVRTGLAVAERIRSAELNAGLAPLRELDPGFVGPAVRWTGGADLDRAIGGLKLTGGDFVRTVKMVADLVGQLRAAGGDLAKTAEVAVSRLRRGVVEV